jgi:hypothetical protein
MQSGAPPKSTLTLQPKKQKFTLVPQLDHYPWLVQFGQTFFGKLVIWALFCGLLYFYWPHWILFNSACLFFCIFFPGLRHIILPLAALGAVFIGRNYLGWIDINSLANSYGISRPIINSSFTALLAALLFFRSLLFKVRANYISYPPPDSYGNLQLPSPCVFSSLRPGP